MKFGFMEIVNACATLLCVFMSVEFIFSLFNDAVQHQSLDNKSERMRKEAALPSLSCCL
jgi:hypothetical protein